MTVVTRGERIVAVVPDGRSGAIQKRLPSRPSISTAPPSHSRPAINSHVHMATQPNRRYAEALLRRDLYSGVTALRDMAGDARALADLSRSARLGDIPSPDIHYSALMAGPQFFKKIRARMRRRKARLPVRFHGCRPSPTRPISKSPSPKRARRGANWH